jgi:hypothetical protein
VNSLTKVLARPNAVEEWRDSGTGSYLTSTKLHMTPFTFKQPTLLETRSVASRCLLSVNRVVCLRVGNVKYRCGVAE